MAELFDNFYKNKRVLITGHTGFKGSWLSLWLKNLGARVIGYSLKPPTKPNLFETCNLKEKIISIVGDIRDIRKLNKVFTIYRPEIVLHLAAQSLVRKSYKNPLLTYETNIMGTVNILEAVRKIKSIKACLIVTSDKCYQNKGYSYSYKEADPLGGNDPYSSSKSCAEIITNSFNQSFFNNQAKTKSSTFLASARAGNVIGGGDWSQDRIVPDCITALIQNKPILLRYPDAIRPWQHVLESLYGYLLLTKKLFQYGKKFTGAWNFGSEDKDNKQVKLLVNRIIKLWGKEIFWKVDKSKNPYESNYLKLNSGKAKLHLGWQPQWDLETALEKTVNWYKAYYNKQAMLNFTLNQIKSYEANIAKRR